jgi:hypothetical protein
MRYYKKHKALIDEVRKNNIHNGGPNYIMTAALGAILGPIMIFPFYYKGK